MKKLAPGNLIQIVDPWKSGRKTITLYKTSIDQIGRAGDRGHVSTVNIGELALVVSVSVKRYHDYDCLLLFSHARVGYLPGVWLKQIT